MDSRTAAYTLSQIAAYMELMGENRFKARAYRMAARSLLALGVDDLAPMLRSGELARVRGLGPATVAVVRDLVETGESRYFEQLKAEAPEGLLELMRVPGLSAERIHKLHEELGIASLGELEAAAIDGRLAKVRGIGPKTAKKILTGISFTRDAGVLTLYAQAASHAGAIAAAVRAHPDVARAEIGGSIRRRREVVGDVDIVAACTASPEQVAQSFTRTAGVSSAAGDGASVSIRYVDGTKLDLHCVLPSSFAVAWWRATGSPEHIEDVVARWSGMGISLRDDCVVAKDDSIIPCEDEESLYATAGLAWIPVELREGAGEVDAAARRAIPNLVELGDLTGVLHCHSTYSDGKSTIREMADAARAKGWSYIGISDHSQAAFYASGVKRENMLEQHDEIDALNATLNGFRVLKGVEADILADGRLDYDEELLGRFDYVIASIHSRFRMDGDAMTERVLRAMDDPHMTILAHPTGRLLLSRDPYAIDIEAVLQKAARTGVAIEVNADPHRLDLDWRYLHRAKELGVTIEIGPDAHSRGGLEWTELGVAMARKGWLERDDILNTRSVEDVAEFAARRRRGVSPARGAIA
jgi:DNA polymerase (family X)